MSGGNASNRERGGLSDEPQINLGEGRLPAAGHSSRRPARLAEHTEGDPATSVNNSDDQHEIVVRNMAVNQNVGRDEPDADKAAKFGTWGAAFGERLQAPIECVKVRVVAVGDERAGLRGKIANDESGIRVGR